jgi:hypothetical protein
VKRENIFAYVEIARVEVDKLLRYNPRHVRPMKPTADEETLCGLTTGAGGTSGELQVADAGVADALVLLRENGSKFVSFPNILSRSACLGKRIIFSVKRGKRQFSHKYKLVLEASLVL